MDQSKEKVIMSEIDVLVNALHKEIGLNITRRFNDECKPVYVWHFRESISKMEFRTKSGCLTNFITCQTEMMDKAFQEAYGSIEIE